MYKVYIIIYNTTFMQISFDEFTSMHAKAVPQIYYTWI